MSPSFTPPPQINSQVNSIIQKRNEVLIFISPQREIWASNHKKVETLQSILESLNNSCVQAEQQNPEKAQQIAEFGAALQEVRSDVSQMLGLCVQSDSVLQKITERCDRKTLNIAVAGVGRSGKSTALKSILGLEQNDNSVIPSGAGPAVTAGKSTIISESNSKKQRTVVKYHTESSFLSSLVNPFLKSVRDCVSRACPLSKPTQDCNSVDEFAGMDLNSLQSALDGCNQDANTGTEEQPWVALLPKCREHLKRLRELQENFAGIRSYLGAPDETIPLNQTSKYVSYQRNGEPEKCFAVREVLIYSTFPNNAIESLQLTDLPGLGTCSESEKKCFLDGFSLSVDMALVIRRPEGLFQNFPSGPDNEVFGILNSTFGKSWEDCVFLFQNDGGIDEKSKQLSLNDVNKWKVNRNVAVIQGSAIDAQFMQHTFLPQVLSYMTNKLPAYDKALIDGTMKTLLDNAAKFDQHVQNLLARLQHARTGFNVRSGSLKIIDRAEQFNEDLTNLLTELLKRYRSVVSDDDNSSTSIYNHLIEQVRIRATQLTEKIMQVYSPDSEEQKQKVISAYNKEGKTLSKYSEDQIHQLRILITEEFSLLENFHKELIDDMRVSIAGIYQQISGNLLPPSASLKDVLEQFRAVVDTPSEDICKALEDLIVVDFPFYTLLYPWLRKSVFHSDKENWITSTEEKIRHVVDILQHTPGYKEEDLAVNVINVLQKTGLGWLGAARDVLCENQSILDVICAALERFQDRATFRNKHAKDEIICMIDFYWGRIQNDKDSCILEIVEKVNKIQNLLK